MGRLMHAFIGSRDDRRPRYRTRHEPAAGAGPVTDRPGLRRIVYWDGFDERAAIEASWRGYLGAVHAELDDGARYELTFYDHGRLGQTLDYEVSCGHPFYAKPGLIVLSEVTVENVEKAVRMLCAQGFFEGLRPVAGDAGRDD
jgi:hypothetical protein